VNVQLSVNALSAPLVVQLIADARRLRIGVDHLENGTAIVDAGIGQAGSLEAGRRIAELCMAGLGRVRLSTSNHFANWPWQVEVASSQPVLACMASQYAGWSLSVVTPEKFAALGSGPARALARKEPLFEELGYEDEADRACLVLEADRYPPENLAQKVADDCKVDPAALTLVLTPTGSLAGVVQITARVVEVAMHKAHELGFPLDAIVEGMGCAPLPPPVADGLTAMGRTNDTILFGGQVHLFVNAADTDAQDLARGLPSSNSADYGKPFAEVFADYRYDFFEIDPLLFSPAKVAVTSLESGETFHAGRLDADLLARSFGQGVSS
jgi:methenyltetrahydromethanopterin cyclohydrolase